MVWIPERANLLEVRKTKVLSYVTANPTTRITDLQLHILVKMHFPLLFRRKKRKDRSIYVSFKYR